MSITEPKKEQMNTQSEIKEHITQAAEAEKRIIMENNVVTLNHQEREHFLALLDNPPPANEALKAAMLKQNEPICEFGF